jgi:hypothetical protein
MNTLLALNPEAVTAELDYRRRLLAVSPHRRHRWSRRAVR